MFFPTSHGRLLALVSRYNVNTVLAEHTGRPVIVLLTSHEPIGEPLILEPVITCLLDSGCKYFVCFGETSEVLHDLIDEFIIVRSSPSSTNVITTWHDDEPATDVVEFFFNIAGMKENSLLVAVLETDDDELVNLLINQASL